MKYSYFLCIFYLSVPWQICLGFKKCCPVGEILDKVVILLLETVSVLHVGAFFQSASRALKPLSPIYLSL